MKDILAAVRTSKKLVEELNRIRSDYGRDIDKYSRKFEVSGKFDWYYGSYGNSSVYKVGAIRNVNKDIVNKVLTNYINSNFDEVVKLIASAHKDVAIRNLPKVKEQLNTLNEIIKLGEQEWKTDTKDWNTI